MNAYTAILNKTVRVTSYRGDDKVREGVVVRVDKSKADEKDFFVVAGADGSYHTFKPDGSPVVQILDAE